MATTPPYAYPFDPTGTLAGNKISGEQHVITPANYRDFHYIVPTFAPFFSTGCVISYRDTNNVVRTLVEGQDFVFSHWFIAASRACAQPVYGSISLLDLTLTGVISVDYQTLGGMWTQNTAKINEILGDLVHNPKITSWDVVVDMPVSFPVIDHQWDLVDMVGAQGVVDAIGAIEAALRTTGNTGIASHIADYSNPHQVTKAQVGLGLLQNYGVADGPATIAGVSAALYVTPFGLKQAMDAGPSTAINTHSARNDNPHAVTAAQTGAYTQAQVNTLLSAKLSTSGTAADTTHFNAMTPSEYRDWALSTGTADNALHFNGMTAGEFKTFALNGVATDSAALSGNTLAQVLAAAKAQQASDSALFAGATPAQFTTSVLAGTAADATKFNGLTASQWESHLGTVFGSAGSTTSQASQASTTGQGAGSYWYELGRTFPMGTNPASTQQDVHWLIAGGDSNGARQSAARYLHLSTRGAAGNGVSSTLINLDGTAVADQIGYTIEMLDRGDGQLVNTVRVWSKCAANHGRISVTELAKGTSFLVGASPAVLAEPAGITYLTEDISGMASAASVAQLRADTEAALDSLTTAFNNLATQVAAS